MNVVATKIPDVLILQPQIFTDDRGYFYESYHHKKFAELIGREVNFWQDNHSQSVKGVLRGLHYQAAPVSQAKLVRVIQGEVFDVAVDLRQSSVTFGQWVGEIISAENKKQIWIPEGFAHGFLVLSETAEFIYKASNYWSAPHEHTIRFDDPDLNIAWPTISPQDLIVSGKDRLGVAFKDAVKFL
jgi:dTDP-4-dehydrorhamnose 3,5-epimerase